MVLSVLAWCVVGLVAVPSLVLLCQCLAGAPLARRGVEPRRLGATSQRFVVLVPAHDEEAVLPGTLASLRGEVRGSGRVLVVADNCTDGTAAVARAAGCDVLERHDLERRGKGYALDCGIASLRRDPPEAVVMVDADCVVEPGAIALLVDASLRHRRPAQALYLMTGRSGGGGAVSAFAWVVRNYVRPLGMWRWGMPCQLMGSGMAFPWKLVSSVDLASGKLAEDMELGAELACAGHPPLFVPDARILSQFPETRAGEDTQRERWIVGHLRSLRSWFIPLLRAGVTQGRLAPVAMALDMAVPPLTLLAAGTLLALVLAGVTIVIGIAGTGLLLLAIAAFASLGTSVLVCWACLPGELRPDIRGAEVLRLATGAAMLAKRTLQGEAGRSWKRTERGPGA